MDKFFIRLQVWLYRLTGGGRTASFTLLLTTTGRHSGKKRTTPLRFAREGNGYVVVGSNAGKAKMPDWFYNIKARPQVEAQVGAQRLRARAEVIEGERRERLWKALVAVSPDHERFQKQTSRVFPVVLLTPE